MKQLTLLTFLIIASCSNKIVQDNSNLIVNNTTVKDTTYYFVLDQNGDTVLKLDPKKYFACFSDSVYGFLVVAPKSRKGWWAIDLKERFLFQIYNTSIGEPSPDELHEDKIRIVDSSGKIGFANAKGEIIIKPQFEMVTAFSNGKAIIGQACKKIPWPGQEDSGDIHYSVVCDQYGYINEKGKVIELGSFTYEEIVKRCNWFDPSY